MKTKIKSKHVKNSLSRKRRFAVLYSRIMMFIKLVLLLTACLFFFTKTLDFITRPIKHFVYEISGNLGFRLSNVIVSGQHNVQLDFILNSLNADTGTQILSLDLKNIQDSIMKNGWIKHVLIERRLPNTLYIELIERTPVAIWQISKKLYLIDNEGLKITDQNVENFSHLIHVVGIDANVYASQLIADLEKYPQIAEKITSAVRYGQRRWNLNLIEGITLKMPENNFLHALDYVSQLNDANKLFGQNYKSIDLRLEDKYYIDKK